MLLTRCQTTWTLLKYSILILYILLLALSQSVSAQTVVPSDLRIHSEQYSDRVYGGIRATLDVPFEQLQQVLETRSSLCDMAILHFNIKACVWRDDDDQRLIRVYGSLRHYREPEQSDANDFLFRLVRSADAHVSIHITGDSGPFGTRDYRIHFNATPIGKGRSLIDVRFSVNYTQLTHWAQRAYFLSVGRNRIGFTVVGESASGELEHVRGLRGMVERNAMRLFLALQVALEFGERNAVEARLRRWFELTEEWPQQLREMDLETYLQNKLREVENQRRLQRAMQ